jgi:16S rRNA (cytosine1407-C5)-methyltransferase
MTPMHTANHLPEKFLERLEELYSNDDLQTVLQSFENRPAPTFRANTLKASADDVEKMLKREGFAIKKISWYPDAFVLLNKSIRDVTETDVYAKGFVYIQNLSSMIPALVMNPKPDEKILDIAAAPGSKTTQIAALMNNSGELTANDVSYKRIFKLKENLTQAGVTNIKILNLPGESLWKKFPEYFDKTLVDVPCSMEGRIKTDDLKSYKDWSPKKIKQLSKLQKYLLRSAISATKIGGTIIYSTCTLSPEENEAVVAWAIEKANGAVTVEPITIAGLTLQNGLASWKKKPLRYGTQTARVIPGPDMEGFFIAKLHKNASTMPLSVRLS